MARQRASDADAQSSRRAAPDTTPRTTEVPLVLFEADSHEPLAGEPWDADRARAGIREIVADAEASFDDGWPDHPQDGEADRLRTLYMGGAGVVDALRRLAAAQLVELQRDYVPYLERSAERRRLPRRRG